jgi:hypothetical protein
MRRRSSDRRDLRQNLVNEDELRAELDGIKKMQEALLRLSAHLIAMYQRLSADLSGLRLALERKGLLTEGEWRDAIAEKRAAAAVDEVFPSPKIRALQDLRERLERGEISAADFEVAFDAELAKFEEEFERDLEQGGANDEGDDEEEPYDPTR